jgi:hypothetical protein
MKIFRRLEVTVLKPDIVELVVQLESGELASKI